MLFMILCCNMVATSVDNSNITIIMIDNQQLNKRLSDRKRGKRTEEKLYVKTQLIDRLYLTSNVVSAYVL